MCISELTQIEKIVTFYETVKIIELFTVKIITVKMIEFLHTQDF